MTGHRRPGGVWLGLLLLASPAQAKPKLPPCPPPAPQLFLSPMGEPFRAGPQDRYPDAAWFAVADNDRDGRLTLAEVTADADRFFRALDLDKDGEIGPDEMAHYERKVAPEIQLFSARGFGREAEERERRAKKKKFVYGAPLGAGRYAWLNLPQPVSAADADFNRGVSAEEFRAAAADRFRQLDKAKQGYLALATLPKTPAEAIATDCDASLPPPPRRPPPR